MIEKLEAVMAAASRSHIIVQEEAVAFTLGYLERKEQMDNPRPNKRVLALFDVDGTLTEPRKVQLLPQLACALTLTSSYR